MIHLIATRELPQYSRFMLLGKSPAVLILALLATSNVYSTEWVKEIAFEGAAKPSLAIGANNQPRIAFMVEVMPGVRRLCRTPVTICGSPNRLHPVTSTDPWTW